VEGKERKQLQRYDGHAGVTNDRGGQHEGAHSDVFLGVFNALSFFSLHSFLLRQFATPVISYICYFHVFFFSIHGFIVGVFNWNYITLHIHNGLLARLLRCFTHPNRIARTGHGCPP
jgi:hypothetical protein